MYCRHCGAPDAEDAMFCQNCGNKLETTGQNDPTLLSAPVGPLSSSINYSYPDRDPSEPIYPPPPPGLPSSSTPVPYLQPPPRHLSRGVTALLVCLVFLLIVASGVIYYATTFQSNQLHAQATALTQVQETATTHARQALATTQAQQATATAFANTPGGRYIQATSGNPVLSDPLTIQTSANWSDVSTTSYSCAFTAGVYHSSAAQNNFVAFCFAQATNFSNFAFQVEMSILSGNGGGLIFRDNNTMAYRFYVNGNGNYDLVVAQNMNGGGVTHLTSGSSATINTGLAQPNLLTVIARASMIYLYINKHYVASISDGTSNSGEIGVFAYDASVSTDVAFSNAQVWNV